MPGFVLVVNLGLGVVGDVLGNVPASEDLAAAHGGT